MVDLLTTFGVSLDSKTQQCSATSRKKIGVEKVVYNDSMTGIRLLIGARLEPIML